MSWDQDCAAELAGAKDLKALERIGRRLSVLAREVESARATVAASEIRAVGLDEFLRRHGSGVAAPAPVEVAPTNGVAHVAPKKSAGRPKGSKNVRKSAQKSVSAKKASTQRGAASKGDASVAEVRAALEGVGKKGMTGAALRASVGGKRFAPALAQLKTETFGNGVGIGRQIRLS